MVYAPGYPKGGTYTTLIMDYLTIESRHCKCPAIYPFPKFSDKPEQAGQAVANEG
jgi:hypothetical protein